LKKLIYYRDLEAAYRLKAFGDLRNRDEWLKESNKWKARAEAAVLTYFEECNANRSSDLARSA
jgi:hypothetical protein